MNLCLACHRAVMANWISAESMREFCNEIPGLIKALVDYSPFGGGLSLLEEAPPINRTGFSQSVTEAALTAVRTGSRAGRGAIPGSAWRFCTATTQDTQMWSNRGPHLYRRPTYCGWTKSISHHFEAMGNLAWLVFTGAYQFRHFLGGAKWI